MAMAHRHNHRCTSHEKCFLGQQHRAPDANSWGNQGMSIRHGHLHMRGEGGDGAATLHLPPRCQQPDAIFSKQSQFASSNDPKTSSLPKNPASAPLFPLLPKRLNLIISAGHLDTTDMAHGPHPFDKRRGGKGVGRAERNSYLGSICQARTLM